MLILHILKLQHICIVICQILKTTKQILILKLQLLQILFICGLQNMLFKLDYDYKSYYNVNSTGNRAILVVDRDLRNIMSKNDESSKKINQIYFSKQSHIVYIAWDPKMTYNVTIIDHSRSTTNPRNSTINIDNHNKVFVFAVNSSNH